MENKHLNNYELQDDQLVQASGGAYTECNRGCTCPLCSSDNIRVFEQDDTLTYFCFACRRGGLLNP